MVYDHENQPMYFRFYDPRVLGVYLPECDIEEAATFFGPLTSIVIEGKHLHQFQRFWPTIKLPRIEEINLNTAVV